jgi:hypothetical protein
MTGTNEQSNPSTGSVAWGLSSDGRIVAASTSWGDILDAQNEIEHPTMIVPLYSAPTLTDAEREAVEAAARIVEQFDEEFDGMDSGQGKILRALLERFK